MVDGFIVCAKTTLTGVVTEILVALVRGVVEMIDADGSVLTLSILDAWSVARIGKRRTAL